MTKPLYPSEIIRAAEQNMYQSPNMTEYKLMQKAGKLAYDQMRLNWPEARKIAVFIGKGNNGGDGIILAALAEADGIDVTVFYMHDLTEGSPVAQQALLDMDQPLADLKRFVQGKMEKFDLIVDALLGIGAIGEVKPPIIGAIEWMNSVPTPVYAIDLPSGLNANTGKVYNIAVKAEKTMTFIGLKPGLYMLDGPDYAGEILFDALGCQEQSTPIYLMDRAYNDPRPKRLNNSHKGNYGRILIVGGAANMGGAVLMAGMAAVQMGAGLVKICCDPKFHAGIMSRQPELMTYGPEDLGALIKEADVIAIGPGLGVDKWGQSLYKQVLKEKEKPLVVDASALTLLAGAKEKRDNWVLTPHPGEAATLLGSEIAALEDDRWHAVQALVDGFGGAVVLKGPGTIVADYEESHVCPFGNPYMAQGGTGDVLTGIIAALMGCGLTPFQAASFGVYVHARAGDACLDLRGSVSASKLIRFLAECFGAV